MTYHHNFVVFLVLLNPTTKKYPRNLRESKGKMRMKVKVPRNWRQMVMSLRLKAGASFL